MLPPLRLLQIHTVLPFGDYGALHQILVERADGVPGRKSHVTRNGETEGRLKRADGVCRSGTENTVGGDLGDLRIGLRDDVQILLQGEDVLSALTFGDRKARKGARDSDKLGVG